MTSSHSAAAEGGADLNPLLAPWTGPFQTPRFEDYRLGDFMPAFETALSSHKAEIDAVASSAEPPTFANTIEALERAGASLDRVCNIFFNLNSAHTSEALQSVETAIAPVLSRHSAEIFLDQQLFRRVKDLWEARGSLSLSQEQTRVLERYFTQFRRAGSDCSPEEKSRLKEIGERIATLGAKFGQNVLADEKSFTLVLDGPDDLAGLPEALVLAAAAAAEELGHPGKHVITLSRSLIEPFLTFSSRRDLREAAFVAWTKRGENGGDTDNRAIAAEMVALRGERARLLGFESFADFRLDDSMAKVPAAASHLLASVWEPAKARAARDEHALQVIAAAEGSNGPVEPWDWRYLQEKRRAAAFNYDEGELKAYLSLERMIEAAFYVASRLFGLSFVPRNDISLYHADARAWEVRDQAGDAVALFLGDYLARPTKRSGAWMSSFRDQSKLDGIVRPIIINVMNFAKAPEGQDCLLSFDDARTLFHEFGHALHGLLSDVTYPMLSGTAVARDFVEFPSQLFEHWLEQPEILQKFALHWKTGEAMPQALLERVLAARNFNQGFASVEYTASAIVDLDLHRSAGEAAVDVVQFEQAKLDELGMPRGITMRHRLPHFQHVFAGDGYSSAYYSYLWSEVLDADGFDAFLEAGDIFDPPTASRLREFVYAAGNTRKADEAYMAFRGRPPLPDALLTKRDLVDAHAQ